MARSSIITATITGDHKGLDRALSGAERNLEGFGRNARRITRGIGLAFTAVAGAAVAGAFAAKPLIDAASSLEEASSKAAVTFGEGFGLIEAASRDAAMGLGLSRQAFLEATSNFGAFGSEAGKSGEQLATWSSDLAGAASDIASFNDLTMDESIQKLNSALAGSIEPLRTVGVFLSETALNARAAEMGLSGTFSKLSEGEKILVRQEEIFAQLAARGTLGDFARTSEGLANTQRQLAARFDNVKAAIGTKLLPVALKFAGVLLDLIDYGESLAAVFSEGGFGAAISKLWSDMVDGVALIGPSIVGGITDFADRFFEALPAAIAKGWEFLKRFGSWIVDDAAPWLADKAAMWAGVLWGWIKAAWKPTLNKLNEWLGRFGGWIVDDAVPFVARKADELIEALTGWLEDPELGRKLRDGMLLASFVLAEGIIKWLPRIAGALAAILLQFRIWTDTVLIALGTAALNTGLAFVELLMAGMSALGQELWDAIRGAWDFVREKFGGLSPLNFTSLLRVPSGLGSFIPEMATGGIVTGPTLAMIGEKGPEAVVPLTGPNAGGFGGGSMNVTVNMAPGANGEDVVAALRRYERQNGSIPIRVGG